MTGSLRSDFDRDLGHRDRTGLARIPAQGGEPTFCRHCSAAAPEHLFRLVGAWSVIDKVAVWDCDSCTRARLHEIEHGGDLTAMP